MFKDYKSIANCNAEDKSLNKQASLHGELVEYLKQLDAILGIKSLEEDYNFFSNKFLGVFNNNKNYSPIGDELKAMINEKTDYYSYSYRTLRYQGDIRIQFNNIGMKSVASQTRSLINQILTEIVKKEIYIEYLLNDTEEQRERVKVQDTVVRCNKYLHHHLANSDLYNLTYSNANTTTSDKIFAHDVISVSDSIKTKPQIYIDKTWCTNVYDKNLQILEFEGARAFTLKCEWLEEDEEKCIYDTQVVQITGTRDQKLLANRNHYYNSHNNAYVRDLFKVRDLALAVSKDGTYWAMGTTPAKATSTMRRRQKLAMMRELNL
jgi:hypothetical protein